MKKALLSLLTVLAFGAQAQTYDLTLSVDMNQQTVGANGVHVAGNFKDWNYDNTDDNPALQQWDPAGITLTDANADGIYDVTIQVVAGTYNFKFVNGNAWGSDEGVPGACAVGGNREIAISTANASYGPLCFASCDACPAGTPDTLYVKFRVNMANQEYIFPPYNVQISDSVTVAGNFQKAAGYPNDWTPGSSVLSDTDGDKIYELLVRLPEGTYAYKYINGVAWGKDEAVPGACNVNGNRELVVSGNQNDTITLDAICFGDCTPNCGSPLPPVNVTFRVDMSNQVTEDGGPFVAGSWQFPNAWDKSKDTLVELDPVNCPRIFSYTIKVRPGEQQFKFFFGNGGDAEGENSDFPTLGCGVVSFGNNRGLNLTGVTQDTILPIYVYNECTVSPNCIISIEDDLNNGKAFTVAPNPFNDYAVISFSNASGVVYNMTITNIAGQVVKTISNISGESVEIQKADLGSGIYFLTVRNNKGEAATKKLIVE